MDAIRCQLIADVEDAANAGEITSFWQYPDFLKADDDHPPLADCMGCVPTYIYDESGAHADELHGELLADDKAEDPFEKTIGKESKAFEESVGGLQPVGALQADSDEAVIQETSAVSVALTGASQAGSDGVEADAPTIGATLALIDSSDKPPGTADEEDLKRAKLLEALTGSTSLLREAGEERIAVYLDHQVTRSLRVTRRKIQRWVKYF